MTLTQLKHVIELAKTGSFIKAAEILHLTQPALSRSIKSLEDELGQKIFDRQGRKSDLTVFGEEVLKRARILLDNARDLRESNHKIKNGVEGRIRIGMGSGPGAMLMTPLLKHMATHFPNMHIEISRGNIDVLVEYLRNRELDALIVDARSMKPTNDLRTEIVSEMPGAFMCRKNHPLTKIKKITFEDLKKYPIASTPLSDEVGRILIERYGPEANLQKLINLRCGEISSLIQLAESSDAILLAIRNAAPQLTELKITPAINANARFGFVTVANRTESPFLVHIREFAHRTLNP